MVGVTGKLVGRVRSTGSDPYGRWSTISLLGRDGREILIISAYNVSQTSATVSQITLYQQQRSQYITYYNRHKLNCDIDAYIDPKKRFVKDLDILLEDASASDNDIILTGDFNEEIGISQTALTKLCMKHGLIDAMDRRHGVGTTIATYKRGPNRIDYTLVTRRIKDHI